MKIRLLCLAASLGLAVSASADTGQVPLSQITDWDTFMKLYPKRALAAGEQGLVAFKLTVDNEGQPTGCQVTHSSGHPKLDAETCDLLILHTVFQPTKDPSGTRSATRTTDGVVNWRLPNSAAPLVKPVRIASDAAPAKKVCKRTPRTGSLAGYDRVCMTTREWDETRSQTRQEFEEQRKTGFTAGN